MRKQGSEAMQDCAVKFLAIMKKPARNRAGFIKMIVRLALERLRQFRHRIEQVRDQAIVSDLEDRSFVVFVDGDDDL